jgi:UDP-N-acetylglucosamine diphosphorylase/glucosamine-1-phosphate N-acetyltransferase
MVSVALFEDAQWQNFSPLTLTRATFDLQVGARTFFEEYGEPPRTLITREYLAPITRERHGQCIVNPSSIDADTIFVNSLVHPGVLQLDRLAGVAHTFAITSGGRLVVARLPKKAIEYLTDCSAKGMRMETKKLDVAKSTELGMQDATGLLSEPWNIISALENSLAMQLSVSSSQAENQPIPGTRTVGNGRVTVGQDAEVEEGTVLDATSGGIYIGPQARISPSRIVGPAYIGAKTWVKQFTIIESSYIGYNCRIAGEIEQSIVSDHTNKAHAGFLGHSYIGEWANIGAMTTTSDLKMTYGSIKMNSTNGKGKTDTKLNKLGSFFADMCKTSIGTLIYSGRRIGVSSHLHGLVADDVPSFTIYGRGIGARNVELRLDSAVETQRKMMSRRGQKMSKAYEQMIEHVFSMTATERRRSHAGKNKFSI